MNFTTFNNIFSLVRSTYSLLCSSLIGFDLQLKLVHQILQTGEVLFVLLRLKIKITKEIDQWKIAMTYQYVALWSCTGQYLIGQLLNSPLIFTYSLDGIAGLSLFSLKFIFQLFDL